MTADDRIGYSYREPKEGSPDMSLLRFTSEGKLQPSDERNLEGYKPICQTDGTRLQRIAVRELTEPRAWIPFGWACSDCGVILAEW